jgi:hypothetical protein
LESLLRFEHVTSERCRLAGPSWGDPVLAEGVPVEEVYPERKLYRGPFVAVAVAGAVAVFESVFAVSRDRFPERESQPTFLGFLTSKSVPKDVPSVGHRYE